jgi:hypothetical protein
MFRLQYDAAMSLGLYNDEHLSKRLNISLQSLWMLQVRSAVGYSSVCEHAARFEHCVSQCALELLMATTRVTHLFPYFFCLLAPLYKHFCCANY